MTDPAADAARSAAVILAPDLGPNLPADHRTHTPDPPPDSLARQIRITLRDQDTALPPAPSASPK